MQNMHLHLSSNFLGTLSQPDFYLHVGGQRQRDQGKIIVAAFNLPEETVADINELARSYNSHMSNIQYQRTTRGREKHFKL